MTITIKLTYDLNSFRCVQVIAGVLGRAGGEGQQRRREAAKRGEVNYPPPVRLKAPEVPTSSEEVKKTLSA